MKSKLSIKDLCLIALFTAFTAVMAQLAIPLPLGVPITLQTFAVCLVGIVLGSKKGFLSILIYILLGAVGVPVFAEFSGGLNNVFGATGGFILSFPAMAYIVGLGTEKTKKLSGLILAMTIATIVNFLAGTIMFMFIMKSDLWFTLSACVFPFIPGAIIKCAAAASLGKIIKKRGLIPE